jgi:hypothetical protein
MSRLVSLVVACAALAACTSSHGGSTPDAPGSNVDPSAVPVVGQWFYQHVAVVQDTCGQAAIEPSGSFAIDSASASTFHVIPGNTEMPFSCALSAGAFDCPTRDAGSSDLRPAVDAVISYGVVAGGGFSDDRDATGTQTATATCAGTQCAQVASFPCMEQVSFVIAAQ